MGTEEKLPIRRILELNDAALSIIDQAGFDLKVSYRVGRLGDACKSVVNNYSKNIEKKRKPFREQQELLQKKLSEVGENKEEREKLNKELEQLSVSFNEAVNALMDEEETIKIPEFKLSFFTASESFTTKLPLKGTTKEVETTYKAGQSLVNPRFFALMGEFIIDDSEDTPKKK